MKFHPPKMRGQVLLPQAVGRPTLFTLVAHCKCSPLLVPTVFPIPPRADLALHWALQWCPRRVDRIHKSGWQLRGPLGVADIFWKD
jgi:hypothetical protein